MPGELRALLAEELFDPRLRYHVGVDEYMLVTIERARTVYGRALVANDMWCGGPRSAHFARFVRTMGWLGAYDLSLLSAIVGHQLAGNALLSHADERQRRAYADEINTFSTVYAFGVSEVGRGSDLRRIGTQAHYDHASRSLRLVTPAADAAKCWISNSVFSSGVVMVLARLVVAGRDEGHHWIRVPVRERPQGPTRSGVRVRRADPKGGIPAVQTTIIEFDGCEVPADQLMGAWARVDDAGGYRSPLGRNERYNRCLETFLQERVFPVAGAAHALRRAAAIALAYSTHRHVYRRELWQHAGYRERLAPVLAQALGLSEGLEGLIRSYEDLYDTAPVPAHRAQLYALTCALKATASWQANQALTELRELCGGHGFHSYNEIVSLRTDYEINTTFAGDNTVLCLESLRTALRDGLPPWPARQGPDAPQGQDMGDDALRALTCAAGLWPAQWRRTADSALARPFAHAVGAATALAHWRPDSPAGARLRCLFGVDSLLALLPHLQSTGIEGLPSAGQLLARRAHLSTELADSTHDITRLLAVPEELLDVPLAHPDYAVRTVAAAAIPHGR